MLPRYAQSSVPLARGNAQSPVPLARGITVSRIVVFRLVRCGADLSRFCSAALSGPLVALLAEVGLCSRCEINNIDKVTEKVDKLTKKWEMWAMPAPLAAGAVGASQDKFAAMAKGALRDWPRLLTELRHPAEHPPTEALKSPVPESYLCRSLTPDETQLVRMLDFPGKPLAGEWCDATLALQKELVQCEESGKHLLYRQPPVHIYIEGDAPPEALTDFKDGDESAVQIADLVVIQLEPAGTTHCRGWELGWVTKVYQQPETDKWLMDLCYVHPQHQVFNDQDPSTTNWPDDWHTLHLQKWKLPHKTNKKKWKLYLATEIDIAQNLVWHTVLRKKPDRTTLLGKLLKHQVQLLKRAIQIVESKWVGWTPGSAERTAPPARLSEAHTMPDDDGGMGDLHRQYSSDESDSDSDCSDSDCEEH